MTLKELESQCETFIYLEQEIPLDPQIILQLIERVQNLSEALDQYDSSQYNGYAYAYDEDSVARKFLDLYGFEVPLK